MWWRAAIVAFALSAIVPWTGLAAQEPTNGLVLAGISHALEGRSLVVSGWVENRGPLPVGRLVIDASGLSPSGEVTAFGSDGIPWQIPPGGNATFSVRLPVDGQLIRAYNVQVAFARPPIRALTSVRRPVEIDLYRSLVLSTVRVHAEIRGSTLVVRADAQRLPVSLVTVEVRFILTHLLGRRLEERRLEVVVVDVPADGTATVHLGVHDAFLVGVRVVDARLKVSW